VRQRHSETETQTETQTHRDTERERGHCQLREIGKEGEKKRKREIERGGGRGTGMFDEEFEHGDVTGCAAVEEVLRDVILPLTRLFLLFQFAEIQRFISPELLRRPADGESFRFRKIVTHFHGVTGAAGTPGSDVVFLSDERLKRESAIGLYGERGDGDRERERGSGHSARSGEREREREGGRGGGGGGLAVALVVENRRQLLQQLWRPTRRERREREREKKEKKERM
jgi:hypothetical protein